ncbi:DUF1206 domain-containing protein [Specibacter cremeus]|uniref:DUF1206 domain-containing protein n=1 Tax=Specibacter cremeus TaxID=1629051 RepID=UPI000F7B160C|nr:DUF1206 domain-containing protein [Specibacter cremeus]
MKDELRDAANTAQQVKRSAPFTVAARSGFVVSGLLHILIGIIAIRLAFGKSGSADLSGAVAQVASDPGGLVLLWIGGASCSILCLWHIGNAVLDHGHGQGSGVGRTMSSAAQGIAFGILAVTFVSFALGRATNSGKSTSDWTARVLTLPLGRVALIALGAVVAAVGVGFAIRGLGRMFRKKLNLPPAGPTRTAVTVLGVVGYIAKGVILVLVGVLFIMATLQARPQQSTGLDGALKGLRAQPYGAYVLTLVGAGLICYGLYLIVKARFASMEG